MEKRLYRSRTDRVIWGVCGGLARYLDMDPAIIRVIVILLAFAGGMGILAYILLAIIVPLEGSKAAEPKEIMRENVEEMKETATKLGEEMRATFDGKRAEAEDRGGLHQRRRNFVGIILIVVGLFALLVTFNVFDWFFWGRFWPIIIIIAGILLILGTTRRHS